MEFDNKLLPNETRIRASHLLPESARMFSSPFHGNIICISYRSAKEFVKFHCKWELRRGEFLKSQ